ncbi:MAG: dihydroorotase, partial [Bacteroidota bacterium]
MSSALIKNANIVNEGKVFFGDVLIENEIIKEISSSSIASRPSSLVIDANGKYLLPGIIDDQVHFREPG